MVPLRRSHCRAYRGHAALVDDGCRDLGSSLVAGVDPAASLARHKGLSAVARQPRLSLADRDIYVGPGGYVVGGQSMA